MKAFLQTRGELIQIGLGLVLAALAAVDMVGRPARAVDVVAIGAGMFGAGLGLGQAIARRRLGRGARGVGG